MITVIEDKICRFLRKIKNLNIINSDTYKRLSPTGSRPSIPYGLSKVHKQNVPIRQILSEINTQSYNLAKFIIPLLKPWSENEYTRKLFILFRK